MSVKLGFIGTGSMADLHADTYKRTNMNVEFVACCDINEKRLKNFSEKFNIEKTYTDYNKMLAENKLDAVVVTTWNNAHAPATIAALNAGVNVFCEKPMALNQAEAIEMKAAAEKNNKLLMIGFVRRFGNDAKTAIEFVKDKTMGDIVYAKASYLRRRGFPGGWFGNKELSGGGTLIDIGVHVIDLTRYIMGCPKAVSVYGFTADNLHPETLTAGSTSPWQTSDGKTDIYNVEDLVSAMIKFDNGAVLQIESSFNLNIKSDCGNVELFGTKAGIKLSPFEIYTDMNGHIADITVGGETGTGDFFAEEDKHFIDCIKNGTICMSTADDGIEIMKIVDAIYLSAKTGKSVEL